MTFDVGVASGKQLFVTLQWSELRSIYPPAPAGGFTDLNLYIMDAGLTQCLASSANAQGPSGSGDAITQIAWTPGANQTVKLVVDVQSAGNAVVVPTLDIRWSGGNPVDAATQDGSIDLDKNYTGQAFIVAAANAGTNTHPDTVALLGFSSGGPVTLRQTTLCSGGAWHCVGNEVVGPATTTRPAPSFTAADGVTVSDIGGFGSPFFGTAEATPHSAACDALIRQTIGGTLTVAQIGQVLADTATERGPVGSDTKRGAGVVNCARA